MKGPDAARSPRGMRVLRLAIAALALLLLLLGLWQGGLNAVLAKAANICMECIGLG